MGLSQNLTVELIPDERLLWKEHGRWGPRGPAGAGHGHFLKNSSLSKMREFTWMICKVADRYFNVGACAELESNTGFLPWLNLAELCFIDC